MAETVERPNTLAGLIAKRREISGQFDPDCDLALTAQPKQFPPRHRAFRGEMQRLVFDALRDRQGAHYIGRDRHRDLEGPGVSIPTTRAPCS